MVHVCTVCNVSESESQHGQPEVPSAYRNYFHTLYSERPVIYKVYLPLRGTWVSVLGKGVGILLAE